MSYEAEISRANPALIVFLIDQSGSMKDPMDPESGQGKTKAQYVADAVNKFLANLVIKCSKEEGIREYYSLGVIGYGAEVGPCLGGTLQGKQIATIREIGSNPLRVEKRIREKDDGAGGLVSQEVKFPVWFDPIGNGGTPMEAALLEAETVVADWLAKHTDCFPPIIINITDGEAASDPSKAAERLRGHSSKDGGVLLFNIHISSAKGKAIEFPGPETSLPDQFAKTLFEMSSPLPPDMVKATQSEGFTAVPGMRGFAFNANMVGLIKFINIGTRPSNLR